HRTMPSPSITKSARADSPIFSLKAPYFLDTSPFGSKSASTGKFSLRSLAKARWDQILSTDMAISSALNFLNSGITIAYRDSWSVHTGLQSAGYNARITGWPRKSLRDTFWSGVLFSEKFGAFLPGLRMEEFLLADFPPTRWVPVWLILFLRFRCKLTVFRADPSRSAKCRTSFPASHV